VAKPLIWASVKPKTVFFIGDPSLPRF